MPKRQQQQQQQAAPTSWQKVLWRQQPYPDNHTDHTFLRDLVVNTDVQKREYWAVALGSAAITQQLAAVVAAAAIAAHLRLGLMGAQTLLGVCTVQLLIGYGVCCFLGGHVLGGSLARGLRQGLLLTGGVYLLSPMLTTLTHNVSEDSVVALATGLAAGHLYLHDYNFVNNVTDRLAGALSLGCAVHAAVLVASSLPQELDVFAYVLFCLELFLLFPYMRRYIRQASVATHLGLTAAMVAAAGGLLVPVSTWLLVAFLAAVVFLSVVCPAWLVSIHKFKSKINGPWDEAVPVMPTAMQQQWLLRRESQTAAGHN